MIINLPIKQLVFLFILLNWNLLSAQNIDCNAVLDRAKAVYEQGNIEEVPEILGDCPLRKSLPKNKRQEALILITETYIHLSEMEKADSTFLLLLKLSPAFKLDSFARSVELERLSKTFRTKPIFNVGINGGANITLVRQLQTFSPDYTTNDFEPATVSFSPGYRGGLDFDFYLGKFFELSTGVDFVTRGYSYQDNLVTSRITGASPTNGKLEFKEEQLWLDAPLLLRLVFPSKKIRPYLYLGGHANFLAGSQFTKIQANLGDGINTEKSLSIFELSDKENGLRVNHNFSLTAGLGIKMPIGLDYMTFDLQYNYQINNAVNRKNRYSNDDLLYKFAYVDNDFALSDLSLTIGYSRSIYKPKKKKKSPYQYTATNSDEVIKERQVNQEKEAKKMQREFLKNRDEAEIKTKTAAKEAEKQAKIQEKEASKRAKDAKIIKGEKPKNQ